MKPLRRREKKADFNLTPAVRLALEAGSDLVGAFEGLTDREVEAELDRLWKIHRNAILPGYIARFAGSRPPHWWKFDAPEPRPRVAEYDGNDFAEFMADRERQRAEEISILRRHKLLSREEQGALAAMKDAEGRRP